MTQFVKTTMLAFRFDVMVHRRTLVIWLVYDPILQMCRFMLLCDISDILPTSMLSERWFVFTVKIFNVAGVTSKCLDSKQAINAIDITIAM